MNYILYGEETATMRKKVNQIAEKVKLGMDQVSVYDAQESELKYILEDASSIPFFDEHKVIVVQNATFLSSKDTTGYDLKQLISYLKDPLSTTTMLFCCPCAKLDQRKKMIKECVQYCKVIECSRIRANDKAEIIRTLTAEKKISIDEEALRLLIERMPLDVSIIESEIDKLELYGKHVNLSVIRELTVRALEDNVFDLADALLHKDLRRAIRLWNDLDAQQLDPIYLIATLASQFRFLFQVKTLMNQGLNKQAIVNELGAHPYRVQMAMSQSQAYSNTSFQKQLQYLALLDQQIKGGIVDKKRGFELYLLQQAKKE